MVDYMHRNTVNWVYMYLVQLI